MTELQLIGTNKWVASTVSSFVANLPELLSTALSDGRCVVVIGEFSDHRYVQFWLDSWDYFLAEVISNVNIDEGEALDDGAETRLREMGWNAPSPPGRPNWWRRGSSREDLVASVFMVKDVVYEILGELPSNKVAVATFDVQRSSRVRDVFEESNHQLNGIGEI